MGSCSSTDHTAEDHIHIDITCNIEEPQQKHRIRTVRNRLTGCGRGATPSWSCDPDSLNIILFPPFLEVLYEIWLQFV